MTKKRKSTLHPRYRDITVVMTNGQKFKTRSTYHADELVLETDKTTHPAWIKGASLINEKADNIKNFRSKYGDLDI